jgi:hypothetical protein
MPLHGESPPTDVEIVHAMERFGGSFVNTLALLCYLADEENYRRIKATWPEYWAKYAEMAERVKAQEEREWGPRNAES